MTFGNNRMLYSKIMAVLFLVSIVSNYLYAADPFLSATIRQDGTLLVNDKPLFPLGIVPASNLAEDMDQIKAMGFNLVVAAGGVQDKFYDLARERGLYVMGSHYIWATFRHHDPNMDLFIKEKESFDQTFLYRDQFGRTPLQTISKYDKHPSLLGWYIAEEPPASYSTALHNMYEIFKSNSPSHIVSFVSAESAWFHHFYDSVDVLMVDCYPYRGKNRSQPEILTHQLVSHAVDVMKGKPVWIMSQGGCQWKNRSENFDSLTEDNYRNQAYLGLIAGAKGYVMYSYPGIIHFGHLDEDNRKIQFEKIKTVLHELKKLSPILCNGKPSDAVRIDWTFSGENGLPPLSKVFEYYGKFYLIVSNIGSETAKAQILGTHYGFPEAFEEVKVFTGTHGLEVKGATLGDTTNTVNLSKKGRFPKISVAPGCSGVFEIIRRAARPSKKK